MHLVLKRNQSQERFGRPGPRSSKLVEKIEASEEENTTNAASVWEMTWGGQRLRSGGQLGRLLELISKAQRQSHNLSGAPALCCMKKGSLHEAAAEDTTEGQSPEQTRANK